MDDLNGQPHGFTRREVLAAGAASLALGAHSGAHSCAHSGAGGAARAAEQPNIVFIISDQHRWDAAGFAGSRLARTPALDALAERSTSFTSMYCQAPLCAPSRQSLLTGRYTSRHGTYRNWEVPGPDDDSHTLAHALRDAGYRTRLVGKSHCDINGFEQRLVSKALFRAYRQEHKGARMPGRAHWRGDADESMAAMNQGYLGPGDGPVFFMEQAVTDESLRVLEQQEPGDPPLFLWSSYLNPHPPLFPPQRYLDEFREAPVEQEWQRRDEEGLPGYLRLRRRDKDLTRLRAPQAADIIRAYHASLAWVDHCIGRLLDGLEALRNGRPTLVVYTSDHGESLGQHGLFGKRSFYEGAERVPCLVSWPGRIPAGERVESVVQHIDLTRTLYRFAGEAGGATLEGRDLSGLLFADVEAPEPEELAYSELTDPELFLHGGRVSGATPRNVSRMLRLGRHKYVHYHGSERLYDLHEDPLELHDLSGAERSAELLAHLRERVADLDQGWATPVGGRGGQRPEVGARGQRDDERDDEQDDEQGDD